MHLGALFGSKLSVIYMRNCIGAEKGGGLSLNTNDQQMGSAIRLSNKWIFTLSCNIQRKVNMLIKEDRIKLFRFSRISILKPNSWN